MHTVLLARSAYKGHSVHGSLASVRSTCEKPEGVLLFQSFVSYFGQTVLSDFAKVDHCQLGAQHQQTVLKHIETMFLCALCFVTNKTLCKTRKSVPRSWKYFDPLLLLFVLFRTAFIAARCCRYLNEREYEIPIKSVEQILNVRTKLQFSLKLELRWEAVQSSEVISLKAE